MPGWAHASKSAQVCPGVPMPSDVAKSGYLQDRLAPLGLTFTSQTLQTMVASINWAVSLQNIIKWQLHGW